MPKCSKIDSKRSTCFSVSRRWLSKARLSSGFEAFSASFGNASVSRCSASYRSRNSCSSNSSRELNCSLVKIPMTASLVHRRSDGTTKRKIHGAATAAVRTSGVSLLQSFGRRACRGGNTAPCIHNRLLTRSYRETPRVAACRRRLPVSNVRSASVGQLSWLKPFFALRVSSVTSIRA